MKTLALIPARGGSKGVPRKNVQAIAGKPLIAWTVQAALACQQIDQVVVSTDDDEIARISRMWGADVPFMRPAELAQDDSPSIDTVLHALNCLPHFDAIVLLQPTSPLRTTGDIADCITYAIAQKANAVMSISEASQSPYWMVQLMEANRIKKIIDNPRSDHASRRQDLPTAYAFNGALYFALTDWLIQNRTFLTDETRAFVMPQQRSVDIDTPLDWKLAELLLTESL